MRRRAFTLVELLVVIAIIALLVAILLPSLGRARNLARLTQSLSNEKQLTVGMHSYRTDFKDRLPLIVSGSEGGAAGVCSWSFGGKWCNIRWVQDMGAMFDQNPADRPLNSYVAPGVDIDRTRLPENRAVLDLPAFRSPGDKVSYQWDYRHFFPKADYSTTSYNDVGTSYHANVQWWQEVEDSMHINSQLRQGRFEDDYAYYKRVMLNGMYRINRASEINASKFVWLHDQTAKNVAMDPQRRNWDGEFGDRNKSVMAFLDGHADYVAVVPAAVRGPGYTFLLSLPTDRHP